MSVTDLILTWPKTRTLESYLLELKRAERAGLEINYRISTPPRSRDPWGNCYMVHDGAVRGYMRIIEITYRERGEVSRVGSDSWEGFWPPGWYIVREARWHALDEPIPYPGFRGFRYMRSLEEIGRR